MKIAYLILTYDRVVDARIQMEIIKNHWTNYDLLDDIDIYHSYNGKKEWYPKKYLEKQLIRLKNPGHYLGVIQLMNAGIDKVLNSQIDYDYIIVASADVWILKPQKISDTLNEMAKKKTKVATTIWELPNAASTEFFVIEKEFAKKVFPLKFIFEPDSVQMKIQESVFYPAVELTFASAITDALDIHKLLLFSDSRVSFIKERKFLNILNRFHSPELGYLSHHDLEEKKQLIKESGVKIKGQFAQQYLYT